MKDRHYNPYQNANKKSILEKIKTLFLKKESLRERTQRVLEYDRLQCKP